MSANDGNWHHICATWENSNGDYQFFKDGSRLAHGTGFKTGYTIPAGGSLVLGQEQDSLGGAFFAPEAFQGTLANVNIWSSVLSSCEIKAQSESCLKGVGDVYKWAHFIGGVKGDTAIVIPSPCSPP